MTNEEIISDLLKICETDDPYIALARIHYDRLTIKNSESTYGVYVQVNFQNYITAVESDAFIDDLSWWIKVDQGSGELYKYARVNYCPKGLMTNGGYNYKLVDGVVVYAPIQEQPEDHNEVSSMEEFFIASKNYMAGDLVTIQGRLYEATTYIPDGGKIIEGTNVVETTIEQYVNKKVEEIVNEKTNL